ncbi:TolC family protein [Leptospira alstonii]|uniref:Outer membrane efflux protein n=2 Tax=Leptospira alstonii TaxID=28452 RepID=M6CK46_9LEPT|nr:TolC family protein [Leptospira alstonii]EMJ90961.1 outer membrane efflux protein [Leptospira alstonii serovar Sichuan str. 79601]EQA78614.1 outer membrane efflux protein [Leptospira alstonii serovar Pingchang str. 80-412]
MVSSQNVLRNPNGESFFENEFFRGEVKIFPKSYRNGIGALKSEDHSKFRIFFFGKPENCNIRNLRFIPGKFVNVLFLFGFLGFVFPPSPIYTEVIPLESGAVTEEEKKKSGSALNEKNSQNFQEEKTQLSQSQNQNATNANPISFTGKIIDWDVERLTEYAVANNPLYLAEKQNMGIERGKVITASLYKNPVLQFQQQFIGVPGGGPSDPNILGTNRSQGGSAELAPGLYQDLDIYGVVSLRSKVAKKSFEAVWGEFDNFDRLFRLRLRQNYWAYLFLTNLVDYNKEFYENYSDLLELTKFRVEKGDISPLEYERLELERIQVEKFYRDALVRRQFVEKELRILSGIREAEGVFAFKTEMKFKSLEDLGLKLKETASVNRPDIAALEERVKEKKLNIDLQRREALGYLQVGGEWRIKGNEHYAGVFATIPLPVNDRGQGKVLSAKEEYKKFELALEAKKREVNEEIEASKKELLAREDLLAKYERIDLLQKNKLLEQKSRIAYVRGASDQVTFLQAEKNYLTVLRDYYEVLYLYYNAVEIYKAAVGKKTERD